MTKVLNLVEVNNEKSSIHETLINFGVDEALLKTPRAKISDLKRVADNAEMILTPFAYMDSRAYTDNGMFVNEDAEQVKQNISNFVSYFENNNKADVYVLTPPKYYSISKHIESKSDLAIYSGKHRDKFEVIEMLIPVLKATNERLDNVEQALDAVKRRHEEANKRIQILDPMLFAIPKGVNIMSDGAGIEAFLGVCWGADITDDVVKDLQLVIKNNMQAKEINSLWSTKGKVQAHDKFAKKLRRLSYRYDELFKSPNDPRDPVIVNRIDQWRLSQLLDMVYEAIE